MINQVLIKLAERGLALPPRPKPAGSYESVRVIGNTAYVAAQFPFEGERLLYRGRLGRELSTKDGYRATQQCALNVLAQIEYYVGFDQILGLNRIEAYMQTVEGWDEFPLVVNGASDLFLYTMGNVGRHARSLVGVERLPLNAPIELTASFTVLGT